MLLDYGLEGYGLYWYCIELIAGKVEVDNITFSLEHDARIIARNTGSTVQKVEEMMRYFIKIGLFENSDGVITCMKLAKRLDQSMTSNKDMRAIIGGLKDKMGGVVAISSEDEAVSHDEIKQSHDSVMKEENRLEENREIILSAEADRVGQREKAKQVPHQAVIDLYHKHLPMLTHTRVWSEKRKKALKARWFSGLSHPDHGGINGLAWWDAYFAYVAQCPYLTGNNDREWKADLEWLINEANLIKVIEGKYAK